MSFSTQQSRTRRFRRFFFYGAVLVVFLVIFKDTTYYSRFRKHELRIVDSNPMQKWLSIYSNTNLDSSHQDTIIPNIVHYVWILESPEAILDLQLKHFISIYSANLYLSPEVIYFHTNAAISTIEQAKKEGNYWTRKLFQVPSLIVRQIDVPNFTNKGMKLDAFEHKSDFVRPRIMYEFGGIYLDFDVLPIRDMKPLRESGFNNIFGHELWEKVNNGVMLSKKGARFMDIYDREQHEAFDGEWISHSVHLLTRMANSMMAIPGEVLILERKAFIPDGWDPDAHAALFRSHHGSSGSGSDSGDAGQFVATATTEYDKKVSLDDTDIETFWNLTKLRKREDWEIDYSSSYTVHALSPHIEARTPDCMEISWSYVQERRSNYAMQIYPAMWHAVKMGIVSGNVQDHK